MERKLNPKQLVIQKALDKDKTSSVSYHKFLQAIKTPTTLRAYKMSLDNFMIFHNQKKYDKVAKLSTEKTQELLEQYIISLKDLKFSSANQRLAAIELFFDMNRVLYFKKILRKLLPNGKEIKGGKMPYTTEEIQRMLDVAPKLRSKAVIHFFASTGCRPAVLEDPVLRMKHIEDMPHGCKSVYVYDGFEESYHAFLTPEASKALDDYHKQRKLNGEVFTEETPVFSNVADFPTTVKEHISANSVRQIIRGVMIKAGTERTKVGKRFDKAEIYGFRKRFNTILKLKNEVNSNIAEKLMAHKRGLDGTYLQPTKEECFNEFYKAIDNLTIEPTERQKLEIQKLQDENNANEKLTKRLESIEKMLIENKQYSMKHFDMFNPEVTEEIEQLVNQLQTDEK